MIGMQRRMQNEVNDQHSHLMTSMLRLKWDIRCLLAKYPMIYLPLIKLRGKRNQKAVDESTEIVIEGYPRSGNTFAVVAFQEAQQREVRIGHHLHAPAQIMWAVKHDIPTLILIRSPVDAITSFLVYEGYLSVRQALIEYIRYYRTIFPFRRGFVVADFRDIIDDFGLTIRRINTHFGTSFSIFKHTKDNVDRCFTRIDSFFKSMKLGNSNLEKMVGRPYDQRKIIRAAWKKEVLSNQYSSALLEAKRIHQDFSNHTYKLSYDNGVVLDR